MKRAGTILPKDLRSYLLTLDNNTIYQALANQELKKPKTENAYWKGITAMRAEPDHRWNSTWFKLWQNVSYEVSRLGLTQPPTSPEIPLEVLEDPEVQEAIKRVSARTEESRLREEIRRQVDRKVQYMMTFSGSDEVEIRKMIYACLYAHCPFKLPPKGNERMDRIISEGYGYAFLDILRRFNAWQPVPLEFGP